MDDCIENISQKIKEKINDFYSSETDSKRKKIIYALFDTLSIVNHTDDVYFSNRLRVIGINHY